MRRASESGHWQHRYKDVAVVNVCPQWLICHSHRPRPVLVVLQLNQGFDKRGVIMRRHLVSAALLATVIAGPAIAADMPLKAPPPVVYGWEGFYLGGQIGGQWNRNDWTTNCIDAGGPPLGGCGSPFSLLIFPGLDGTAAQSLNNSGLRVGAYFGAITTIWN